MKFQRGVVRGEISFHYLQGIRAIKLLAWEMPLRNKVATLRKNELNKIWDYLILNGMLREMMFMAGPLMSIVMFSTFAFTTGKPLTTAKVFRCLAFVNILRFPLNLLSQAMKLSFDGLVSVERLEKFLLLDTLEG